MGSTLVSDNSLTLAGRKERITEIIQKAKETNYLFDFHNFIPQKEGEEELQPISRYNNQLGDNWNYQRYNNDILADLGYYSNNILPIDFFKEFGKQNPDIKIHYAYHLTDPIYGGAHPGYAGYLFIRDGEVIAESHENLKDWNKQNLGQDYWSEIPLLNILYK